MRPTKIFILAMLLMVATLGTKAYIGTKLLTHIKKESKGFAVIELFTSEGCSSCPPADALVAKIAKEDKDMPVYILAYHVDYWNRLGWKDAFSSADFSKRQNEYASYLHLRQIYTPQIIVNGKTEFVGSEEGTLRSAIKTNLQVASPAQLSLGISAVEKGQATIKYSADGTDSNTVLLIAVLQKNAQTKVERGENVGRTLSHVQIVRKLQKVALNSKTGTVNVSLPNGYDASGWELVGLLQNTSTGAITGAAKIKGTSATI
ncbi:DUF1223 domain-containing protein [Mucilaginibacter gotjawali]|uniref:Uncharacterized protein n=2 Tax=Mucilaginibacter gotjawali TaxID=1550579 RepID=A0A839SQT8_9SPHI|nr:DUF1223 domain-containing protein [Mucilaginibacter gotjawali]MBB3058819.1 hypothetical protein [Mucilaginibacter gotjawali]BAU52212.1 hypothetical protein MgSA37_00362 [Mucilaginibacter gotjawali]